MPKDIQKLAQGGNIRASSAVSDTSASLCNFSQKKQGRFKVSIVESMTAMNQTLDQALDRRHRELGMVCQENNVPVPVGAGATC